MAQIIFHIGSASENISWGEYKIKKSSKQRYRVSYSEKTDCKALENVQRTELLRFEWSSIL